MIPLTLCRLRVFRIGTSFQQRAVPLLERSELQSISAFLQHRLQLPRIRNPAVLDLRARSLQLEFRVIEGDCG